jgi:hypothetical protein
MKRFLFILLLLGWGIKSFSQTETGNYLICARTNLAALFGEDKIEFNGTSTQKGTSTNVTFYPSAGNFLLNNLAVGLTIPVQYSKSQYDDETQTKTVISVSPFIQYFIGKKEIKPYVIVSAGYNYMTLEASNLYTTEKKNYSGVSFEGGIGFFYFFNNHIAWDFELAYETGGLSYSSDANYKYKYSYYKILSGFSLIID